MIGGHLECHTAWHAMGELAINADCSAIMR